MKKKVLVILLIIVSLFLFVACDGRDDEIVVGCIVDEDRIELPIKTIFMDKAYVDTLGANPIWLAFIVCVVYVSVIVGLSLLKFKREEI